MSTESETFESIVVAYDRAADARAAATARAEALDRKAERGLPGFRAIRLRAAERARREATAHEAEVLRIVDKLEMLQRKDLSVPRLDDTAAMATWRHQLREIHAERARLATEARNLVLDAAGRARIEALAEWVAMLETKLRQAEAEQPATGSNDAEAQG